MIKYFNKINESFSRGGLDMEYTMENYANLHTHTTHSDGVFTPAELVRVAKEEGYRAIAVTDHDTATAYPELCAACEKEGLECIFGVEFSVVEPKGYHIVGFNFDPEYPPMADYLRKMSLRQTDRTKHCFDEAVALGKIVGVTWDDVLEFNKGVTWFSNNHIFRLLLSRGLVEQKNYMSWFVENFLHQRSKYPPIYNFVPLSDMVKLIKDAGGIAIVAHPHGQLGDIDFLIENGISGLEINHSMMTPDERRDAYKIAIEKNLFISGGSDHEGLCGGLYDSYPTREALLASPTYVEPMSTGTAKCYYEEIKNSRIMRK